MIDYPDTGCEDFDVRLAYRDQGSATGNVEICMDNVWMAACSSFFQQEEINVTCRALGFNAFELSQFFHESINPIINDTVSIFERPLGCFGGEPRLASCQLLLRRKRNLLCDPSQVVRVRCQCECNSLTIQCTVQHWVYSNTYYMLGQLFFPRIILEAEVLTNIYIL